MDFPPYDRKNPHRHWLELFELHDKCDLRLKYTAKKYYADCKTALHDDVEAMSGDDLTEYNVKYGYTRPWVTQYKLESFSEAWAQAAAKAEEIDGWKEDRLRWNRAEGRYYKADSESSLSGSGYTVDINIGTLKLGSFSEVEITVDHTVLSTSLVVEKQDEVTLKMVKTELQSRGADAVFCWSQELQLMAFKIARLKQEADKIAEKRLTIIPFDKFDNYYEAEIARDLSAATAAMNDFVTKYPTLDAYRELLLLRQNGQQANLARMEHGKHVIPDDANEPASGTGGEK